MRAALHMLVMLLLLGATTAARAAEPPCDPAQQDCGCEHNWGCWDLLYTTKGTVLGIKATSTLVTGNTKNAVDGGVLSTYFTEHTGTRRELTARFAAFAAIGGGSAGTEGGFGGTLGVGWRASVTPVSGPFVRGVVSGVLLGHERLYLSMFEPLQLHAGYQLLDGDLLLEWGLSSGLITHGRYDPDSSAERSLSRSVELGAYTALHFPDVRVDVSFSHLVAQLTLPHSDVDIARLAFCSYPRPLALCVDALFVKGDADFGHHDYRETHSLYTGLTVGLTP